MTKADEDNSIMSETPFKIKESDNFGFVNAIARIATYDDFKSSPRLTEIHPAPTAEYIEALSSTTYQLSKTAGGTIPYTVIREVSENFIHSQFEEIVVSIFNNGNTIRFSDQGPGINDKDKVQLPGFTSAIEPMKQYIRGVGSGFPIVKEYLDFSNGSIVIEDNINKGAVITISIGKEKEEEISTTPPLASLTPHLNNREKDFLLFFAEEGALGVTDMAKLANVPQSSTHAILARLEEYGLIEKTFGQKRILTELGFEISKSFH